MKAFLETTQMVTTIWMLLDRTPMVVQVQLLEATWSQMKILLDTTLLNRTPMDAKIQLLEATQSHMKILLDATLQWSNLVLVATKS